MSQFLTQFMRAFSLAIGLLTFFCFQPVQASSPVFAIIDFFPFGYTDQGKQVGLAYDAIAEVERISGIDIEPKLMSVPRALRDVSLGKVDMLFSYKDPKMVPNVTFLGNIGCLTSLIVPRKDSGITAYDDMHGKRIGFVGLGYFDVRKRDVWNIQPVVVNDNFIMLNMLIRGRIDAMIVNDAVLNSLIHLKEKVNPVEEKWVHLLGSPLPLDTFETHFSMNNNSTQQHLAPKIEQAIKTAQEQGVLKRIFQNYGSPLGGKCFSQKEIESRQWLPQ